MDHFQKLSNKQLLVPPFRRETGVSKDQIPVYSTINPIVPPFLPYRCVCKYPRFPSAQEQIEIIKNNNLQN
ncbi:hypothetical protein KDN24_15130 [Bacillus sp. Bva_UNVM-123]|uniref:hypothetical protein n=1 Tax=Bacillus sp. Bva_UNVM-123 TaxID=2829798 RepID=UPI00391FA514